MDEQKSDRSAAARSLTAGLDSVTTRRSSQTHEEVNIVRPLRSLLEDGDEGVEGSAPGKADHVLLELRTKLSVRGSDQAARFRERL